MSTPAAGIPIDSTTAETMAEVGAALAALFDPAEVKWKPQVVKGNKARAIAYIDVRLVCDRLDEVLGVGNWQDEYAVLPDGSVTCRLRLRLGGQWITKMDVGSPSEQPDGGDRLKAAFSDALKRTAVKFGIGRYLYRLPAQWVDYDPAKKQLVTRPQLPNWALPDRRPQQQQQRQRPQQPPAAGGKTPPPADAKELSARVKAKDDELATAGRIARGALVAHVLKAGQAKGCPAVLSEWRPEQFDVALAAAREFVQQLKPAA